MSATTDLTPQVLALPPAERAQLAAILLRSLDDPEEEFDETGLEFEQMLQRRIDEVRSGRAELLDFDEAMRRLDELQQRRVAKES